MIVKASITHLLVLNLKLQPIIEIQQNKIKRFILRNNLWHIHF